jgi:hypothetical protein
MQPDLEDGVRQHLTGTLGLSLGADRVSVVDDIVRLRQLLVDELVRPSDNRYLGYELAFAAHMPPMDEEEANVGGPDVLVEEAYEEAVCSKRKGRC